MTAVETLKKGPPWLKSHLVVLTRAGSHLYGTNLPESDDDFRGVTMVPSDYLTGFAYGFEQFETSEPVDLCVYEFRKFFRLATQGNPNVLELLFVEPKDTIVSSPTWETLRTHRDEFLSEALLPRFFGYAQGQLKKMVHRKEWILNPPSHKPTHEEFGLPEGRIKKTFREQEQNYKSALARWNQYCQWLRERNEARSRYEAMVGYDCKNAMHLVRLLRMAVELKTLGKLLVYRTDAAELLEIRRARWSYEKLMGEVDNLNQKFLESTSVLPRSVDKKALHDLCSNLVLQHLLLTHKE
jgi:predicted nucleotidyltransferase